MKFNSGQAAKISVLESIVLFSIFFSPVKSGSVKAMGWVSLFIYVFFLPLMNTDERKVRMVKFA